MESVYNFETARGQQNNTDFTIHPTANIHKSCVIGTPGFSFSKDKPRKLIKSDYGIVIGSHVYIASFCSIDTGTYRNTIIGHNTIIDSHVHISHDCIIGNNCEIDTGVRILGEVEIGDNSRICTNAIIHPLVKIGNNCVVGANSYLRHDLKDGEIAYGSPATVKKNTNYAKRK